MHTKRALKLSLVLLLFGLIGCLRGTNAQMTLVIDAQTLAIVGGTVESVTVVFEQENRRLGEILITNPAGGPIFTAAELDANGQIRKSAVVSFKTTPSDFVLARATGYNNAGATGAPLVASRGLMFLIRENDGSENFITLTFEVACGNNANDEGELCDDGNVENGDGCDCGVPLNFNCGDGDVDAGETCDDGNQVAGDGCNANCQSEECGDGLVNNAPGGVATEDCDDGNAVNTDDCLDDCSFPSCGDGFVRAGVEDCDPPDGVICDDQCLNIIPPGCGDGTVTAPEECDDNNNVSGDGCNAVCVLEFCGDGIDNNAALEQCDLGAGVNSNTGACTLACQNAACGDTFVQPSNNEECDDGNTADNDGCDSACLVEAVCGDGVLAAGETCDDANTTNGDGCSSVCAEENGFNCVGAGAGSCDPICGDGLLRGGEACDDNNTAAGDGCAANCTVENGANCAGEPSVCNAITCGDNIGAAAEVCDGTDFRGETCASLNAATPNGALACLGDCSDFDQTGCTP
jgi:cysteine-rich repeat protein